MAKVRNNNARRAGGRLRSTDFPLPERISDEQFQEACEGFGIPDQVRARAKAFLDRLVDEMRGWMNEQQRHDRRGDLKRIKNAQRSISAARGDLRGLERDGRDALRLGSERLGWMLSADWVAHRFPGDAPTRPSERSPERSVGDYEGRKRAFVQYRAPEMFKASLRDIESSLTSAARSLKSPGGQRPLIFRHSFIFNLATFWQDTVSPAARIAKKVVGTPGSEFGLFCEYIFKAVGWPTDGLSNAISDAVRDWLHLRKYRSRLSK